MIRLCRKEHDMRKRRKQVMGMCLAAAVLTGSIPSVTALATETEYVYGMFSVMDRAQNASGEDAFPGWTRGESMLLQQVKISDGVVWVDQNWLDLALGLKKETLLQGNSTDWVPMADYLAANNSCYALDEGNQICIFPGGRAAAGGSAASAIVSNGIDVLTWTDEKEGMTMAESHLQETLRLQNYAWNQTWVTDSVYPVLISYDQATGGDYSGYWPVQTHLADAAQAFHLEDYDQDGRREMLMVRSASGDPYKTMVFDIYEVRSGKVQLAASLNTGRRSYPLEEGLIQVYLYEDVNAGPVIVRYSWELASFCADGITLACDYYKYDGASMKWLNGFSCAGSAEFDTYVPQSFAKLGINSIDLDGVVSGSLTAMSYTADPVPVVEVIQKGNGDYTGYYQWMDTAKFGDQFQLGEGWVVRYDWIENLTPLSGYILPDSGSRLYSVAELMAFSNEELRLARNEIYARHGRTFKNADLQNYFNAQSWYEGTVAPEAFNEGMLSAVERQNVDRIMEVEASR